MMVITERATRREVRRAERAERYWFFTRCTDGRNGKRDGKANLLAAALEDQTKGRQAGRSPAVGEDLMGLTPHLGTIDHHFRGKAAAVRERAERDIADAVKELNAITAQIAVAEGKLADANLAVDAFGTRVPTEQLERRNAVEKHQPLDLIKARNQREWDGARRQLLATAQSAARELESLKVRWAELDGTIGARRSLAGRRARKLHEHALRRQRTYERRLVLSHAEGSRLVTLLQIHRPELPDWVAMYSSERAIRPWLDPVASAEHASASAERSKS